MKRSLAFVSLAGSLFLAPLAATAAVVTHYDIDFSSPTHTAGLEPSMGSGSDQISGIVYGNPSVESTFGGIANQSLHFGAGESPYETIQLDMGQGFDNYQISFDFYSSNLSDSSYMFGLLTYAADPRNFNFSGTVGMQYSAPDISPILGGGFADNAVYNVMIDYDLLGEEVSIWLNGGLMGTSAFTTTGGDIDAFRFSLAPALGGAGQDSSVEVNLDNILVTSTIADEPNDVPADVPEPSALLLLSLGLLGLVSFRPDRKRA